MSVSLNTRIKPREPAAGQEPDPSEPRQIEATGETYEAAYAALKAQVPAGWVVIGIKRW